MTTIADLYFPMVAAYHAALVLLLLAGGRPDRVTAGVTVVIAIGFLANVRHVFDLGWSGYTFLSLDAALLCTVAFVLSQTPRPIGGQVGSRIAMGLWVAAAGFFVVDAVSFEARWAYEGIIPIGYRNVTHDLLFPIEAAILALHTVPAVLRTERGPARAQTMILLVAFGLAMAEQGVRLAGLVADAAWLFAIEPIARNWRGIGAIGYFLYGYFMLYAILRLTIARGRDNRVVAVILGFAASLAIAAVIPKLGVVGGPESLVPEELAFQVFRPLLIGFAVLQYEYVAVPAWLRRALIPVTLLLALLGTFLAVQALFSDTSREATTFGVSEVLLSLAVLGVAGYAARGPLERTLSTAIGTSAQAERAARLRLYAMAIDRDARMGSNRGPRLRRKLGITAEEHHAVVADQDVVVLPRAAIDGAKPGALVGRVYTVRQELGGGGQGRALLADGPQGPVVLKEVVLAGDEQALGREHDALVAVDHPHVAKSMGIVAEPWGTYMVREYIEGSTLEEHVEAHGPLPADAWARLVDGTTQALNAMHQAGIAHLDVKPANIVLGEAGTRPVLIDAGAAKHDAGRTVTVAASPRQAAMSLRWAAPEQLQGRGTGAATDWFQWAGTMYYAATGEPPVQGSGLLEVQRGVLHPAKLSWPKHLPADVVALVDGCRAAEASERVAPQASR